MKATFANRAVGKSVIGQGAIQPGGFYETTAIGPSYEEYMRRQQLEQEKYKMEDFKRRELEYAMRSTKPFKPFI